MERTEETIYTKNKSLKGTWHLRKKEYGRNWITQHKEWKGKRGIQDTEHVAHRERLVFYSNNNYKAMIQIIF